MTNITKEEPRNTGELPVLPDLSKVPEEWLIQALLDRWGEEASEGYKIVEEGARTFIKSSQYTKSRYHVISTSYGDTTIYQTVETEKYQQSVVFSKDRFLSFIAALLEQRRNDLQKKNEDTLGDLDDHPF